MPRRIIGVPVDAANHPPGDTPRVSTRDPAGMNACGIVWQRDAGGRVVDDVRGGVS